MVRLDQPDVIEEEFVAPGRAQLSALEEDTNFRRRPILIIGQDLDDDRNFVRRVAFKDDLLQREFFGADARALFDRAFDDITRDARFARFLDRGEEARIAVRIGPAHLRGDHDFLHQLAGDLAFL